MYTKDMFGAANWTLLVALLLNVIIKSWQKRDDFSSTKTKTVKDKRKCDVAKTEYKG